MQATTLDAMSYGLLLSRPAELKQAHPGPTWRPGLMALTDDAVSFLPTSDDSAEAAVTLRLIDVSSVTLGTGDVVRVDTTDLWSPMTLRLLEPRAIAVLIARAVSGRRG